MFCVAFGLSMDYEVFLLSRIKEEHDHGADNVASVARGLERTGFIVTAAAALMSIIFMSFATSGITFIKLFGIGLTMAVLMDATLIRGTLVPAFMRLAGNANWWAPAPLRRFYDRYGIREHVDLERRVIDLSVGPRYPEAYISRILRAVADARSTADVDQLLAEEGLTEHQLDQWRSAEPRRPAAAASEQVPS
jgi:hypothetical protein